MLCFIVECNKKISEDAKIGIRNARKDANNDIKKLSEISEDLQKNAEFDVQEMTDLYVKKIDDIFHLKEKEIMTV